MTNNNIGDYKMISCKILILVIINNFRMSNEITDIIIIFFYSSRIYVIIYYMFEKLIKLLKL